MIAKRDRRPLHLAAAEHLRQAFTNEGEEVAEVIAAHLLDAYRAGSADGESEDLRLQALAALRRAAVRAAAVGAPGAAARLLRTAIELTDPGDERTELLEQTARVVAITGPHEAALELYEQASAAHLAAGRTRDAARLSAGIGLELARLGRNEEAIARMRPALEVLDTAGFDPGAAELCAELAGALIMSGRQDEAPPIVDRALIIAEALERPDVISRALGFKAVASLHAGRFEESGALYDRAIELGERHRLPGRVTAQINAADTRIKRDMADMVELCESALETCRRLGNPVAECNAIANLMTAKMLVGPWQEVERLGRGALESDDLQDAEFVHYQLAHLFSSRGELDAARSHLAEMESWRDSDVFEAAAAYHGIAGQIMLAEGELEPALEQLARVARESLDAEGPASEGIRLTWADAVAAALALTRLDAAEELIGMLGEQPRGLLPPLLRAELSRARARLGAARGEDGGVETGFQAAITGFQELGYPFELARAQTDLAAWLIERGRGSEATETLDAAAAALGELGAEPLLRRVRELQAARSEAGDARSIPA
jgi:tetratricopeptide (TPR) repeat protein